MNHSPAPPKPRSRVRLRTLARSASIAVGIQFGWALQLSLLTPFSQQLGIPHRWSSFIWLCGPITGIMVQPLVGVWSDSCASKWGRRRPFILTGALMVCASVLVIGFSADLGSLLGDPTGPTSVTGPKWNAVLVFVLGFWLLDLSNNTLQGPCRAILADFTGRESKRTRRANAYFSAFMALGNILGFAAGAYPNLHSLIPSHLILNDACNVACANLKTAYILHILILLLMTALSITAHPEQSLGDIQARKERAAERAASLVPPPLPEILPPQVDQQMSNDAVLTSVPPGLSPSTYGTFTPLASASPELLALAEQQAGVAGATSAVAVAELSRSVTDISRRHTMTSSADQEPLIGRQNSGRPRGRIAEAAFQAWGKVMGVLGIEVTDDEEKEGEGSETETDGEEGEEAKGLAIWDACSGLSSLPLELLIILGVTALTWLALFPFLLFDTDWMGREVFRGSPQGGADEVARYNAGVHWGSFGLVLNSIVQGIASLQIDPLVRWGGSRGVWAAGNMALSLCLFGTVLADRLASGAIAPTRPDGVPSPALAVSLLIFASLGVPMAVTFSIPYTLASTFTTSEGGGQGAAMGVLNLAVVLPQMFVALATGPFDEHFGGGNLPAFFAAAVIAAVAALAAYTCIPSSRSQQATPHLSRTNSSPFP